MLANVLKSQHLTERTFSTLTQQAICCNYSLKVWPLSSLKCEHMYCTLSPNSAIWCNHITTFGVNGSCVSITESRIRPFGMTWLQIIHNTAICLRLSISKIQWYYQKTSVIPLSFPCPPFPGKYVNGPEKTLFFT